MIQYGETEERLILAADLLGEDEDMTGRRIAARKSCASSQGKFAWMRFDVCVERSAGKLPTDISRMRTSRDAEKMFRAFLGTAHLELQELFGVIVLDSKNSPLGFAVPGTGGVSAALVNIAEVYKPALLLPGAAIVVCHNHPSGDPMPSRADIELTKQLVAAGRLLSIQLLDHLILTANDEHPATRYYSFADNGILQ